MSTRNERWAPDDTLYDIVDGEFKGVRRLRDAVAKLGLDSHDRIITSRDPEVAPLTDMLRRTPMPAGFDQWQLPVVTGDKRPALTFITVGAANAEVPEHVHMDDPLFRLVLAGSILYNDIELMVADWMIVPAGQSYSFVAGRLGCVVLHTYHVDFPAPK